MSDKYYRNKTIDNLKYALEITAILLRITKNDIDVKN